MFFRMYNLFVYVWSPKNQRKFVETNKYGMFSQKKKPFMIILDIEVADGT